MRARPLLAVVALAAVGLTACGSSDPAAPSPSSAAVTASSGAATSSPVSPAADPAGNGIAKASDADALKQASAALAAARSVHVVGDIVSGKTKIRLDLRAGKGRTGRGSVTLDGARFDVVATGSAVYIGGNDAFWKQAGGASGAALFRGKYLKTNRKDPAFEQIAAFFDLADLSKNLLPLDGLAGSDVETVAGVPARVLKDGGNARYAVSTTGKPYPLEWSGTEGSDRIALTFSEYDKALDLTPPPAGKVVDTAKRK